MELADRRFHVQHRRRHAVRQLGHVTLVRAHRSALDPFVSHLYQRGEEGWVVLIDAESGAKVAERRIRSAGPNRRTRPRQRGCSPQLP